MEALEDAWIYLGGGNSFLCETVHLCGLELQRAGGNVPMGHLVSAEGCGDWLCYPYRQLSDIT